MGWILRNPHLVAVGRVVFAKSLPDVVLQESAILKLLCHFSRWTKILLKTRYMFPQTKSLTQFAAVSFENRMYTIIGG